MQLNWSLPSLKMDNDLPYQVTGSQNTEIPNQNILVTTIRKNLQEFSNTLEFLRTGVS